jgi:membrane peptidoglycan carboxypeptidase
VAGLLVACVAVAAVAIAQEARSSRLQSRVLARLAAELEFPVRSGPSEHMRYPGPGAGPHDLRLGYARMPDFIERLAAHGHEVTAQARPSPRLLDLQDRGLFAIYPERSQGGLELHDCRGDVLYAQKLPRRVFGHFDQVPPLLVDALLFIEDRSLLNAGAPRRNPAVAWNRLAQAVLGQVRRVIDPGHAAPGGSTLATQIEKYRHSYEGRTRSMHDKLQQMASASVRAYLDGEDTEARRRQIVADYLDTVPLAGQAGMGEVHGLGDGLWAWYGRDFEEVKRLLRPRADASGPPPARALPAGGPGPAQQVPLAEQALAFKQALSLLVAQRRPSYYLGPGASRLASLTDSHLRVLAEAGIISRDLRNAALPLTLHPLARAPTGPWPPAGELKLTGTIRARLSTLLGVPRAHDLDRLDLNVTSTVDGRAQRELTRRLRALRHPEGARAAGLLGQRMLRPGDDPDRLVFSLSLYERGANANVVRVQADSSDDPFDINEGARLDLGSTAKLRTLVTYLELVADMHERWHRLDAAGLRALAVNEHDALGRWARSYLLRATDRSLSVMTEAAMERRYPASPAEAFHTGGGVHHFVNFDPAHDGRVMSVREALRHSVNLVFIRLMRDIVNRHLPGPADAVALPQASAARQQWLARFADQEGSAYIRRFYGRQTAAPGPLTAAHPREPGSVHPLDRWVAGYLREHPNATLTEVLAASRQERQDAYAWLFKTRRTGAQEIRIRSIREAAAFEALHRSWQRLGYPFDALTPSYASAIGASGDRPAALAQLMGILANDGLRLPVSRSSRLLFAPGTPYETWMALRPTPPVRVLPSAVAQTVRHALRDVVEAGTARRLKGSFTGDGGRDLPVWGKTGTGDRRLEVHGPGGRLVSSSVIDRTATLAFAIGDRHFGTVMVHAHEPDAAGFRFTSALAVQVLRSVAPVLSGMLDRPGCAEAGQGSGGPAPDEAHPR